MAKQIRYSFLLVVYTRIVANVVDYDYSKGACHHLFYIRLNVLYMYWKRIFKPTKSVSFV